MTPEPVVEAGIEYWNAQPATYDGVLGGFGTGPLPRIDALDSRLFLLSLFPELSTVSSALQPLSPDHRLSRRTRALDVGAGVGRVTCDVLLYLVSDVVLLEPVEVFVNEALTRAKGVVSTTTSAKETKNIWRGLKDQTKSVTFLQGTLQDFDLQYPHRVEFLDRVGYQPARPLDDIGSGYDVIWCQWCLGHLSDPDLVAFLLRSKAALRKDGNNTRSLIVVKENLCQDHEDGSARTEFDEQDSSLTRSDMAFKALFKQAGLKLVKEQVQKGFPEILYAVKMYGLR
ncbi:methyltransferase domain containing protein [Amanita muscaria]